MAKSSVSDSEDVYKMAKASKDESSVIKTPKKTSFFLFAQDREVGNKIVNKQSLTEKAIRWLLDNSLLHEHEVALDYFNKVFCAQWLTDYQVVFGTKCNKLMVWDIKTKKMIKIPNLKSREGSSLPENPCGIHALATNPSETLIATGGENPNDVAVYRLPTFDPVCIGEGAHKDWIFDIKWLDDRFFVSGARDTTIALWKVEEGSTCLPSPGYYPQYFSIKPLTCRPCKSAEKIRALVFNPHHEELIALSLNAYLHSWDIHSFKQKSSHELPFCEENVCLVQKNDYRIYAVGSKSDITLIDSRSLTPVQKIPSQYPGYGVRSLSFFGDLLTVGTGVGALLFYDVRICRHLENHDKHKEKKAELKVAKGWLHPSINPQEIYPSADYSPAIYTHCYDSSGTQLFTAGGPLAAKFQGSYAAVWH